MGIEMQHFRFTSQIRLEMKSNKSTKYVQRPVY